MSIVWGEIDAYSGNAFQPDDKIYASAMSPKIFGYHLLAFDYVPEFRGL